MELKSAGTQQGVDQVTIQGIAYSCKLDHDHIQHIVPTSKLETVLSAENTAQPMCAPPYARSHSLESSAGCKLLRPTAIKVEARCPSSHGTARGIAQHSTPSFRQTSTAGHLAQTNRKPRCHDASATKPTIASRYLHLHHQLQTNLVGAHCVGYCNGVRQTAVKESLIFSQDDISTCFDPAAASKQAQLQQPHPQQQTQHSNVPSLAAGSEHDSKSLVAEGMQTSVPSLHGQSNTLQHQVQQPQPPQQHMQQPLCHQQLPSQQKPALHGKADSLSGNVEHTPREKRKCVISGPEATSQAGGKRPGSLIKFRCNIRDILDTAFPGWDSSSADAAPSSSVPVAAAETADRPVEVPSNWPAHEPTMLQSKHSDAASADSATSSAPPCTPSVPQPMAARVLISHLTAPNALLSTGSSSNLLPAESASLTEEEAKQAMPPPRGRRATAESVQAAVAAAQWEDWATVAQAAAWGSSFPGAGPFTQLGAAAWNIAYPQQVADMMTHVSTAASQQPSSSIAEGCSHPPASPLSSAPTSRPSLQTNPSGSASALLSPHCRAASPAVSASSFVSARNGIPQHPSSLPMFSQYPLEAVLPCPQPWGAPQQPYVLSSLPHVMHQLLEEPSIDFLHSWNLPSFPVQPSASDVAGDQLPAKKPCKGKRQQSAAGHATQNGISQRQTAGESMVGAQQRFSHQQSAPGQSSNSQVGGSSQQHIPRGQASVDQQQSSRMQTGQANGLQATAATSSWPGRPPEDESRPTPLQLMKHRARQRVAEATTPRKDGSGSVGPQY